MSIVAPSFQEVLGQQQSEDASRSSLIRAQEGQVRAANLQSHRMDMQEFNSVLQTEVEKTNNLFSIGERITV